MVAINMNAGGVYRITCATARREYIGSTKVFLSRIAQHIRCLSGGKHVNRQMQADWDRYGQSDFLFEVVQVIPDRALYIARERELIAEAMKRRRKPYNLPGNRKPTAPTQKRSARENTLVASRDAVVSVTEDGDSDQYMTLPEAAKALKVSRQTIYNRIRQGTAPAHIRLGDRYFFERAAVDKEKPSQ